MSRKATQAKVDPKIIIAIIAAIATILAACISLLSPFAERIAKGERVAETSSSVPVLTQTPNRIILQDDFSLGQGPGEWNDEFSFARVIDNIYRFGVTTPHYGVWQTYSGIDVVDFYIKANIFMTPSTNTYSCGIIFRQNDNGRYYFGINNEQSYEFFYRNVNNEDISFVDWEKNVAIKSRGTNTLEVIVRKDVFELYVNGVKLNTFIDNTSVKGEFGFYVATYGGGEEAVIEFDNLLVEER